MGSGAFPPVRLLFGEIEKPLPRSGRQVHTTSPPASSGVRRALVPPKGGLGEAVTAIAVTKRNAARYAALTRPTG